MMCRWATRFVFACALLSGLSAATNARAESPPAAEVATRPNRPMIVMGLLALVGAYTPALLVASNSPIYSDSSLYVPILGPWLDLADRPKCGPGSVRCRVEAGNETILAVDGVFQAWGIAAIVVGFLAKEYVQSGATPAPAAASLHLNVAPARVGVGGYGLGAFGTF